MQARGYLSVRVVAVHVECRRCGARERIEHSHPDTFTTHVLQPLASWWIAHLDPKLVMLEVLADGEPQQWQAAA